MAYTLYSHDVRSKLHGVHKVALAFTILQILLAIALFGCAFSFGQIRENVDDSYASEEIAAHDAIFYLLKVFCLIASLSIIFSQIWGIFGYGLLNSALVVCHIVFSSISLTSTFAFVLMASIFSAPLSAYCAEKRMDGSTSDEDYYWACTVYGSRLQAITAILSIELVLAFVVSILGCVGVGRFRSSYDPILHHHHHGAVVVTAPPVVYGQVYTQQPGAYPPPQQPYGQPYSPPQHGYGYPQQQQPQQYQQQPQQYQQQPQQYQQQPQQYQQQPQQQYQQQPQQQQPYSAPQPYAPSSEKQVE